MDLMIRRDIRQLMLDAKKVRRGLGMLEQDHDAWARERQQYDLIQLIKRVKRLESDVSMMQSDCMSMLLSHQKDDSWQVVDSLHRTFATLNILFNDLKQVRMDLNSSYIHPDELKQLEIDWDKFRNTIGQIQKYLQDNENLLKIKTEIPLGRELEKAKAYLKEKKILTGAF